MKEIIVPEVTEHKIFIIRGHRVMLDQDLAKLYRVTTGNLNKAVKRNLERFPEDFMLQLTKDEENSLRFQFGSLKRGQHAKYLPYSFTEQGVAMLSSVLRSKRAIQVNIAIMWAFVKLKQILSMNKELAHKLAELERKIEKHDVEIQTIFEAIRQLMAPSPVKPKPQIGFHPNR
ncbi:MAG: ORF6N domain-containing protein [Candidatus Omnitrophica bacterium]|nr:ORF6N domain-containing protein [Candidatus Omnitrophota bacterium]